MGVTYIPWSKLKPDIDVELLEDGGVIDEDTIPEWLKAKLTENAKKKLDTSGTQDKGFLLGDNTPTTTVDTSQPPPLHAGGLLPPPPMAMPLVSPFSLNTRLLGPMGHMGGMMPNIPIGVPPPNLPGPLLANQLLGMGSPFTQAPPGMMSQLSLGNQEKPPGLLPPPNAPPPVENGSQLAGSFLTANTLSSEENMDIEMEDADKSEKPMPLSDQLLAAISGPHFNRKSDEMDFRDGRDSRSRDRNDRTRDNRGMRSSRDRGREREPRNDRRSNRWSDREHKREHRSERSAERDLDKKDASRNEKPIAERLRDMAHEGIVPARERPPRDRSDEKPPSLFSIDAAPPDRAFPKFPNGERIDDRDMLRMEREDMDRNDAAWRDRMEPYRHPDDYEPPMRRHPDDFHPDFHRPDFDNRHGPYQEDRMDQERYEYEMRQREMFDRRDSYDRPDMRMMDDYEHRGRGPDFFPHPRDNFGPRPLMRGPGPDGFLPRPLLGRPPGPHMFHPRGMGPRGPRPGVYLLFCFTAGFYKYVRNRFVFLE